jgi:glycosyltransferase involved in cell wall biosynthesis
LRHQNIQIIPYGLDLNMFYPQEKKAARSNLKLPIDCKLIVFGAADGIADERKGIKYLRSALKILAEKQWGGKVIIGLFGNSPAHWSPDPGMPVYFLGKFTDEKGLAQVYSAADVFVAPSVQDNLPNTVMEAMACATPVVAFNIGGMPDMIDHQVNGYLSKPYEADDLADGIEWVLMDDKRHQKLCRQARKKCEDCFSMELQAQRYAELYKDVLTKEN